MNRELIYDALLQPDKLKMIPRAELERVAAEYPYFNPAQVLLARIYQNEGDHRFSDQLLSASNTSGDRVSLYHYLKQVQPVQTINIQETSQPEVLSAPVGQVTESAPEVEAIRFAEVVVPAVEAPSEDPKTVSPPTENEPVAQAAAPAIAVTAPPEKEDQDETENILPEDLLDREVLLRAVFSTIEQDVIEDLKDSRSGKVQTDETGDAREPGRIAVMRAEQRVQDEEKEQQNEEEEGTDGHGDPFARYLMRRAREIGYEEEENSPLMDETSEEDSTGEDDIQDNSPEDEDYPGSPENQSGTGRVAGPPLGLSGSRKRTQQELIDRFIQSNPKITPGRTDDYDLDSIARTSVTDDLSLVSETMAELLASQGKKEKAKKVYRKLMELHPEKSIYFAARLKNVDKLK